MQHAKSISRYKQKLLIFLSALFIALILQPNLTVYADPNWAGMANAIVNSTSNNNEVGTDVITNGVSVSRTGYLAYMVNKETGAPTSEAKAFYADSNWIPGSQWIVSSRHGGLSVSSFTGQAEWGKPWIPPAYSGDPLTSLEPNIKEWFRTNGSSFVNDKFPENHPNFVADTEVLVLETIMNCQFSVANMNDDAARAEAARLLASYIAASTEKASLRKLAKLAFDYDYDHLLLAINNYELGVIDYDQLMSGVNYVKDQIINALAKQLKNTGSGRTMLGDPVIGTVPNLLKYDQWNTTVFDTYLNNGAPQAEKIVYSEAGFTAYPGSGKLTDAEVQQYGVAMIIIHCTDPAQTTCDESLAGTPHNPPKESEGKVTIVKSYRTKDSTGAFIDDGTYSLGDLGTQILIENEQVYQVVGWKTSTTTNTGIKSTSWNPPSSVVQQGTTPKSVTLQPTETCLYVLLEKVEEEEVEPLDWNYRLTESSITRTVWFSNPDNPLTNMNSPYIQDHPFQWTAVAHQECPGHTYYGPCQTTHDAPCDCSGLCPANCKAKATDPTHVCVKCTKSHKYNCDSRDCPDNKLTAYCKGWQWKEKQLFLSINNTHQNSYPDILATKEGWNSEVREGGIIKHYYRNDSKFDRLSKSTKTYIDDGWDYVCILMRGKDKLTLAEWQNNGEGNNTGNNANDDLRDASSSGFTVANTDSGTRKTTDYYETFNTYFGTEHNEGVDNETTWWATIDAVDEDGNSLGKHTDVRGAYVSSPLSVNNIVVKVETYSGTAAEHKNDTTCHDGDLYYPLPGYTTSSGRMVKSGGIISFTPYIEMKYDTLPAYNLQAYVLSEFTSQITPNDYAELSWNQTNDSNLSLISAQWSTHADACQDWGTDNVLPGGATLSLNIKKDARQKVAVTTWQCIITDRDGFFGKTHVEKTGGSYGNLTEEQAISAHQAYVATVQAALESTNIQQYVEKNPNKSDAFSGLEVNSGVNISSLGTGAQTASTELKYYFRDDNTDSPSNEGDLDVNNLGTSTVYYHFAMNTSGDLVTGSSNGGAVPVDLINKRTLVVNKLEAALEQGARGEGSGYDDTANTGPQWYNEAFDGITVIMQQTILEVGYNDPPERSSVLDPKLTPKQTSQKSLFSKYFLSQFKTQDHSAYYNEPYIMGEFKNAKVKLKDMDYLFHSRKFWIPNATTQDLH